jgi:hypothetical protein
MAYGLFGRGAKITRQQKNFRKTKLNHLAAATVCAFTRSTQLPALLSLTSSLTLLAPSQ